MNNRTVENYLLNDSYQLKFTLLTVEWRRNGQWLFFSAIMEHNSSNGKRRPYFVVEIGQLTFQSGWLFDRERGASGKGEE